MTSRSFLTARSLVVAILTLVLAAGVAAAARPEGDGSHGLDRASDVSGKTVPNRAEETTDPDADGTDGATVAADAATTEHPENHGKYVSEAAHAVTPEDCDNHGAYVRLVAKSDLGKKGTEPGELPTSCAESAPVEPTAADATGNVKSKHSLPAQAKGHGHGLNR